MIPLLISAGVFIASAIVIGVFWNEIKEFLNKAFTHLRDIIAPAAIMGYKTYVQTGSIAKALYRAGQVAIQKCFSKGENGTWKQTVVTSEISFEDLPADIREQLEQSQGKEVDITEKVAEELKLAHT